MIYNEEKKCCCEKLLTEGIFEKSFENEKVSVYGRLIKNNEILIRYHNSTPTNCLPASIIFDDDEANTQVISFTPCKSVSEESFCYKFNLKQHNSFCLKIYKDDTVDFYSFTISEDPFEAIIQRYNLDNKETLPVTNNNCNSIIQKIKYMLANVLSDCKLYFSKYRN